MTMARVASTSDVPPGSVRVFQVNGRSIALANLDGSFYAVDNLCTHDNGPLGEGTLPLAGFVAALEQAGCRGWYDVELLGEEVEASSYDDLLERSKAAFSRIAGGA